MQKKVDLIGSEQKREGSNENNSEEKKKEEEEEAQKKKDEGDKKFLKPIRTSLTNLKFPFFFANAKKTEMTKNFTFCFKNN